jgi:hypothetical protein
MKFVQLVDKESKTAFLQASDTIDMIAPHSYADKDGERYNGTIIRFKDPERPAHFVFMTYLEVVQKLMKAPGYVLVLETP